MKNGTFIAFEGLDGCGKSTQISLLGAQLSKMGVRYLSTKEPSDSPLGLLARKTLLGKERLEPETLALLFAADRREHMAKEVLPALEQGLIVLCDRFVYSNMAFQGTQMPVADIAAYNNVVLKGRLPDITVFIDTSPEECTRRIYETRSNIEIYDGIGYAEKIRRNYLSLFDVYKDIMPVKTICGSGELDEVFFEIMQLMEGEAYVRAVGTGYN